jgi:protein ImuB
LFRASDDANHLHTLLIGQLDQVLQSRRSDEPLKRHSPFKTRSSASNASAQAAKASGPLAIDDQGTVWRVTLQATLTGPIVWEQTELFEEGDRRSKQHFAQLIDTLSGRLGRGQVLEARIERDAEPEQAVSYKPLTGRRNDGTPQQTLRKLNSRLAGSGAEPQPTDPMRRPTRLLVPAEPLTVVSESVDGPPSEFVYDNRRERVINHWGPERLESGWWRGPSMRRDYFRIETAAGEWWWIFRDMTSGTWHVHGLFG